MANYHVTNPKDLDGWRVKREGSERSSAVLPTQKEAEKYAKELSAKSGGGEVMIHRSNGGPIRNKDTAKPGYDPRGIKG